MAFVVLWFVNIRKIVLQGCLAKKSLWQKMLVEKYKHFLLIINRVVILENIVVMGGGLCATPLYV